MSFYPHTIVESAVKAAAEKYRLPPATVHAVLGEFIQAVHEASFKGDTTEALKGIYFTLGPEAAWHFWGLIYRSLDGRSGDELEGHRSMWYETALRLDSEMKRFASILDRWTYEKEFELNQARLDEKDSKRSRP
jgi:hypothetical protein